jgi:hypothetical protein
MMKIESSNFVTLHNIRHYLTETFPKMYSKHNLMHTFLTPLLGREEWSVSQCSVLIAGEIWRFSGLRSRAEVQ